MAKKGLVLDGKRLTIRDLDRLVSDDSLKVKASLGAITAVKRSHVFINRGLSNKVIYGVNTGFGPMANYILAPDQLLELQENLILSHAVGMGDGIDPELVLPSLAIRLNTLLKGYSGVSPELISRLEQLINLRILPFVPEHGAVGTSGDLVQLAHMAMALLGRGKVNYRGKLLPASQVLARHKISPYKLKVKEGLSLINGTSLMTGVASRVCLESAGLLSLAIRNGCMALELVRAYDDSFSEGLNSLRPHAGQVAVSGKVRKVLRSSSLIRNRKVLSKHANYGGAVSTIKEWVQEIYSLRCLGQILGPVYDAVSDSWKIVETEMNSVTDNPIIDTKKKEIFHGGNFHGDYVAVSMDRLKMSLVKLTMLSERRLNFFLNHKINNIFPPFLNLHTPGLTLGLQGLQFVATSTTAQNQTLAYPMNLHSISTNGDNQDVVSMGTDASLLTRRVADNAWVVLAIESLALCQAVDFLKVKNKLSDSSLDLYEVVRKSVPRIVADRELTAQLARLLAGLKNWEEVSLFDNF